MLLAETVSGPTILIGLIAVWYLRNPNMFK